MADKKRLEYVDMVKGIAILVVVMYHLVAPVPWKTVVIDHIMDVMLISFFFFSGYFHRPGKRTLKENLKNRTKALLVPFFKYSIAFWAIGTIYLLASGQAPLFETFACLRNYFAGCIWNRVIQNWFGWNYYSLGKRYFFLADFWFLVSLLFASILFLLIVDRVVRSKVATTLSAIGLFAVTGILQTLEVSLPYNMQIAPFWAAFMLLGALAGNHKLIELPDVDKKVKWIAGMAALLVGLVLCLIKAPNSNIFRGSFGGENEAVSMMQTIGVSIPFIWGISEICYLLEQAGVRTRELSWLGFNSVVFYIYHMFFAWIICIITGFSISYPKELNGQDVARSLLLTVLSFALCILTTILKNHISSLKKGTVA